MKNEGFEGREPSLGAPHLRNGEQLKVIIALTALDTEEKLPKGTAAVADLKACVSV